MISLIDKMGSDCTVVNAARVSFYKQSKYATSESYTTIEECLNAMGQDPLVHPDGNIKGCELEGYTYEYMLDEDAKLLLYLAKHEHFSPFCHAMVQWRIKMPIFAARQWFKHRMGVEKDAGWNEVSRRYVKDDPEFYFPDKWRAAVKNVKQGSSSTETIETIFALPDGTQGKPIKHMYAAHVEASRRLYLGMIEAGVAAEQARLVLPMSMMTEWVETGSLMAYARICKLRLDPHAQAETRVYAQAIHEVLLREFPLAWKALISNVVPSGV